MNFSEYYTLENATRIFSESCKRAKPGADRVTAASFEKDLQTNVQEIRDRIIQKKYKFTRFEVALKVKRYDKLPRLLFKSTIRDRLTAKMMCEYMQSFYSAKDIALAKTREAVLNSIADVLQKKRENGDYTFNFYLRLDISNFFDSINRATLHKKLTVDGIDDEFLAVMEKMFFTMDKSIAMPNGRGVPQGLSISSLLAERYICDLDKKYLLDIYRDKVELIRYVDDIIVFTSDRKVLSTTRDSLLFCLRSEYGLQLNQDKITAGDLRTDKFEYLGAAIENHVLKISETQYKRVADQMESIFRWYKRIIKSKQHPLNAGNDRLLKSLLERINLLVTGYYYKSKKDNHFVRYGWILTSLPRQIADYDSLKRLDGFSELLIEKYIDSEKGKDYLRSGRKSFYQAFLTNKFTNNEKGYILDRDRISKDVDKMYKITCNLSFVDVKYELDYNAYEKDTFETKVGDSLQSYFSKTLYLANRSVTSDIMY